MKYFQYLVFYLLIFLTLLILCGIYLGLSQPL